MMMAGTLIQLGKAGCELHVMNVASGNGGSLTEDGDAIAHRRTQEARDAAAVMGATYHPPISNDLEIFYCDTLLRKLASVVREVEPTIVFLQSPQDYMEDHMICSRLGATAAFARCIPNFITNPPKLHTLQEVTLYHALPWGLRDPLRKRVRAGQYVDVTDVLDQKREALACHRSQKEWLDATQGLDSYLQSMDDLTREVGEMSGRYEYAEGWRRHLHYGYCAEDADPLTDLLGEKAFVDEAYEKALDD
jgi:LmbE family N-acetylglucosaminyl deacetylase